MISTRLVTTLFVLALFSVGGGLLVIITMIGGDPSILTGLATTGTGEVNITISASTAITLVNSSILFGTGALNTDGTATRINTTTCASGANPDVFSEPCPISVRNDGNVDVNITFNGTPAANWLVSGSSGSTYEFAGATGGGGCPAANLTTTRKPVAAALTQVCANLTWADPADDFNIEIFLNLTGLAVRSYNDTAVFIRADRTGIF